MKAPRSAAPIAALDSATPPLSRASGATPPSDAMLVAAARAGERRAQEALFLRHRRMVAGLVRRHHPRTDDLDDLVHDTFIAAFQSLGTLKNPQAFASWLGSTAIRLTHKQLRRLRLSRRLGLGALEEIEWEEVRSPACTPEVSAELSELSAILDTFPAKERIALVLRKVFGMSLEEIAEATSASLATVKRRVAAAEDRLDLVAEYAAPLSPPAAAGACAPQET